MSTFKVQLLSPTAFAPARQTSGSAGYDLVSPVGAIIQPRKNLLVDLQQKWEFGPHLCARICPRSSLACKDLTVDAGVVDSDFRGSVSVLLVNRGDEVQHISAGQRIAQMILQRIEIPDVTIVSDTSETHRGEGGFGSTGF